MVTKEQIKDGLLRYIDSDVIPNLPSLGKWSAGTAIVLATSNYDKIYDKLVNSEVCKMLNITDGEYVDIDRLAEAVKQSASKYGKMEVSIPIIGTLYFTSNDVERLQQAIHTEAMR